MIMLSAEASMFCNVHKVRDTPFRALPTTFSAVYIGGERAVSTKRDPARAQSLCDRDWSVVRDGLWSEVRATRSTIEGK
jgi:hypothetical protein